MQKNQIYRLADSTVIELLVNRWFAWSHLIAPVTASLHLANYQIKAMQSYLADPGAHIHACRVPELIGGPFLDIPVERANEIKHLLQVTEDGLQENLHFAKAIMEFQNWLMKEAHGQSLEPYYLNIPQELAGFVELVYDYYHRPSVRFLEGLLYESEYYHRDLHSLRIWRLDKDGTRPFFMSTPRLLNHDQGDLEWVVPFDSSAIDDLFELDITPKPLGEIREILGISSSAEKSLLPFLSATFRAPVSTWAGDQTRIRYFGHACVLVECKGISILTDPYVGVVPSEGGVVRYSYHDLPKRIDFALVTHNHQDHFSLETLLRLRHRIDCLVVPRSLGFLYGDISLKRMVQVLGFKNVIEMDTFDTINLPDGEITGIPFLGEHADLAYGKSAYLVRFGDEKILFAADSDLLDPNIYQNVRRYLGRFDTVFIGTECIGAPLSWHCGDLLPHKPDRMVDQSRRYHGCDSRAALQLLELVGARRIYNYAMGMEPWVEHLLGLGLSPTSPQIRESDAILTEANNRGFVAAERLYGAREFLLGGAA
jgi:L-ascorbate metabolism protein UlaG (beta-lactamase superfamily)